MPMIFSTSQRVSQQQLQTFRLSQEQIQGLRLLQMQRMELAQHIREELQDNPLLEDTNESDELDREDPILRSEVSLLGETERPLSGQQREELREAGTEGIAAAAGAADVDWVAQLEHLATASLPAAPPSQSHEDLPTLEQTPSKETSLQEHLLAQIRLARQSPDQTACAELIIWNLDEDGFLTEPLAALAEEAGVSLAVAQAAREQVQRLEPVGCAASDACESLIIQATALGLDDPLLFRILTEHRSKLLVRNFAGIAQALSVSLEEVKEVILDLRGLSPRPARNIGAGRAEYITPDVIVHKLGESYVVQTNDDGLPRLHVSTHYLKLLKHSSDKYACGFIRERLEAAKRLIASIQQRQRTIVKVMESIVKLQRDFLEYGVERLRPMVLRDVANDIKMVESTVSRATRGKYVHTPQGLFEMRFFFSAGLDRLGAPNKMGASAAKGLIRSLVANEDPSCPYSDQDIVVKMQERHGVKLARRTVAKYREQLGIEQAALRARLF